MSLENSLALESAERRSNSFRVFFSKHLGGILALTLVAWTLFAGLGASRLWDRDEPRNARCTEEMLARNDWVVPMFNDQLRTHKPILLYWSQMLSYSLLGVSSFSARLPSALSGLGTVLALYVFVKHYRGPQQAIWSAVALSTSLMFVVAARAATPDALLICFSALAILALVRSQLAITGLGSSRDARWLMVGYTSMGMAALAKGPVGIALPSIVAGTWLWLELHLRQLESFHANPSASIRSSGWIASCSRCFRHFMNWCLDWKSFLRAFWSLQPHWGIPLALAIAAPWYFWVGWRTDGEWLRGFFLEHNLGRAVQSMEGHGGGFWYYPMAALVGLFPNTLLLLPIAIWCVRSSNFWSSRSSDYRLGAIWIVVYMLIFSAASTKLPSYITPCYVGAAILFGGFYRNWQQGTFVIPRWLMITATCVMIVIGLGFAIAMIGVEWKLNIRGASFVALWSVGLFAASFAAFQARQNHQQRWVGGWTVAAGAVLIGGLYVHGAPVADRMRTDLDALIAIEAQSATEGQSIAWMAIGTIEPSWVFYLKKTIPEIAIEQTLAASPDKQVSLVDSPGNPMVRVLGHLEQPNSKLIVDQQGWSLAKQLGLQDQEGALHTELRTMRFGRKQELIVLADDRSTTSTASQVKPENSTKR